MIYFYKIIFIQKKTPFEFNQMAFNWIIM